MSCTCSWEIIINFDVKFFLRNYINFCLPHLVFHWGQEQWPVGGGQQGGGGGGGGGEEGVGGEEEGGVGGGEGPRVRRGEGRVGGEEGVRGVVVAAIWQLKSDFKWQKLKIYVEGEREGHFGKEGEWATNWGWCLPPHNCHIDFSQIASQAGNVLWTVAPQLLLGKAVQCTVGNLKVTENQNWSPLFLCKIEFLSRFVLSIFWFEASFLSKFDILCYGPCSRENEVKISKKRKMAKNHFSRSDLGS